MKIIAVLISTYLLVLFLSSFKTYLNFLLFDLRVLQLLLPTICIRKFFSELVIFPEYFNWKSFFIFSFNQFFYVFTLLLVCISYLDSYFTLIGRIFYPFSNKVMSREEQNSFYLYYGKLFTVLSSTLLFKVKRIFPIQLFFITIFLFFLFASKKLSFFSFTMFLMVTDIVIISTDVYSKCALLYRNEMREYGKRIILNREKMRQIRLDRFIKPIEKFFIENQFKNIYTVEKNRKTHSSSGLSNKQGYIALRRKVFWKKTYHQSVVIHEYGHIKYKHTLKNIMQKNLINITSFSFTIIMAFIYTKNEKNSHIRNIKFYFVYLTIFTICSDWSIYLSNMISSYFEIQADLLERSCELISLDIVRYLSYLENSEKLHHLFLNFSHSCFISTHPPYIYRIYQLIRLFNQINF